MKISERDGSPGALRNHLLAICATIDHAWEHLGRTRGPSSDEQAREQEHHPDP